MASVLSSWRTDSNGLTCRSRVPEIPYSLNMASFSIILISRFAGVNGVPRRNGISLVEAVVHARVRKDLKNLIDSES